MGKKKKKRETAQEIGQSPESYKGSQQKTKKREREKEREMERSSRFRCAGDVATAAAAQQAVFDSPQFKHIAGESPH